MLAGPWRRLVLTMRSSEGLVEATGLVLEPLSTEIPTSTARLGDQSWKIDGVVLEGFWKTNGYHLIATTDDIPNEDGLHFALLSTAGVVECVSLRAAYTTGNFRLHEVRGSGIRFSFFGDAPWMLCVRTKPIFHMPLFGDPRGVTRPWTFSKRLVIEAG